MKRGTPRHPKVGDLMQAIGTSCRATAVGYLEMLWHFTSEFAPQGDIGRFSPQRIEAALEWKGKRGKLIAAFLESGWMDQTQLLVPTSSGVTRELVLTIHDWHDHCDESTRKRLSRAGLSFLSLTEETTVHRQILSDTLDDSVCLPHQAKPQPQPGPSPQPQPHVSETNGQLAIEIGFVTSTVLDFREWIKPWERCSDPGEVAELWKATILSSKDRDGAFQSRNRYLASDEVARGVIMSPQKFLVDQKKADWEGKWPRARRGVNDKNQRRREEVNNGIKLMDQLEEKR